jgi:hypothetical protein
MREKGLAVTRVKQSSDADNAEHQHADDAVSGHAEEDSVFEALAEPIAKQ